MPIAMLLLKYTEKPQVALVANCLTLYNTNDNATMQLKC